MNKTLVWLFGAAAVLALPSSSAAFCGFYVAGQGKSLYNNATMVTLMRGGDTTVMSMRNNYQGPVEDFAMVVPVPVVLQKKDVKTLPHDIFARVDKLAAPRLVEYWEQDPCPEPVADEAAYGTIGHGSGTGSGYGMGGGGLKRRTVKVEARFTVGEYQIVILSATEATGLESWLEENGYKIPAGAAEHLKPYVASGSKFFVAKVDPEKVAFEDGMATLSPLRFHYPSKELSLPVRLGLINSQGKQDLLVHILARHQRYEVANYPNVTIPTNLGVANEVRNDFASFYAALFDATLEKNPGAVVTEYAWSSGTCDPCPTGALRATELHTLGLDVLEGDADRAEPRMPRIRTSPPTVGGNGLSAPIIRRLLRRQTPRLRACFAPLVTRKPDLDLRTRLEFAIAPDGTPNGVKVFGVRDRPAHRCLAAAVSRMKFPRPKSGGIVTVRAPIAVGTQPGRVFGSSRNNWVLTRLHARYSKDVLGEDLVFRAATPISGGRGSATDLSQKAEPSSRNTFQGRYIIRHPWTGPIECENPRRGVWGGPPPGVEGSTSPKPALELAFAKRGGVNLTNALTDPVPALQVAAAEPIRGGPAAPEPPPPSAPGQTTDKGGKKSSGCGCRASSPTGVGATAVVLVLMLGAARRYRRRPRRR